MDNPDLFDVLGLILINEDMKYQQWISDGCPGDGFTNEQMEIIGNSLSSATIAIEKLERSASGAMAAIEGVKRE